MVHTLKRDSSREDPLAVHHPNYSSQYNNNNVNVNSNSNALLGGEIEISDSGLGGRQSSIHIGNETVISGNPAAARYSNSKDVRKASSLEKQSIEQTRQATQEDETLTDRALKPKYTHRNKNT